MLFCNIESGRLLSSTLSLVDYFQTSVNTEYFHSRFPLTCSGLKGQIWLDFRRMLISTHTHSHASLHNFISSCKLKPLSDAVWTGSWELQIRTKAPARCQRKKNLHWICATCLKKIKKIKNKMPPPPTTFIKKQTKKRYLTPGWGQ